MTTALDPAALWRAQLGRAKLGRAKLVKTLVDREVLTDLTCREAFVPRFARREQGGQLVHHDHAAEGGTVDFLAAVYADTSLITRFNAAGIATSPSTQPSLMAIMLERLDRCLLLLRRALEFCLAAGLARQPDRFSVCSKRDAGGEMIEGTSTVADLAAGLRGKLVDELCEWEPFRMAAVEDAMRTVPRHVFLPGVPLEEAYSHDSVVTHRDSAGVALSCASQPGLVAAMLEQLDARPGHRVMEIGAGTGYNAALLAYLAGPEGQVTTVEIDAEVAEGAQRNLNAAGSAGVRVICGDGEDGCPATAPFDRIIVTAGAWDIPPAWLEQLTPGGRIVVPLRIRGLTRSVALERDGACWRSRSTEYCGFVPLRGAGHQPERNVRLDSGGKLILRIDEGRPADGDALRRSLGEAPAELWTGTAVTDKEKKTGLGDLDYWLATQYDLCRLLTRSPDHGLVAPVYGWGSMAVRDQETFAYITKRPAGETGESELGVCAYGPDSEELASRAVERIRAWDTGRRLATQIEVFPYGAQAPDSGTLLVADKRHIRVIVRVMPLADRTSN